MRRPHSDEATSDASPDLARRVLQPSPMVLVALFGCLAFGPDDRGLHIAVIGPKVRGAM